MKTTKNVDRSLQFQSDLKWGKYAEATMKEWVSDFFLENKKPISYLYDSDEEFAHLEEEERKERLKDYDLKFRLDGNNKELTFEVKSDRYPDTGNLAFEYKHNGKESGIFRTKADYFIYFMPRFLTENIYIIKSEKMVELLSQTKWKNYFNYGGDLGTTVNYIVPKDEFNEEFISFGGRIETMKNVAIPAHFNLTRFPQRTKQDSVSLI